MGLQQGSTAKGAAAFSGSQEPWGHTEGLSSTSSYQLFFTPTFPILTVSKSPIAAAQTLTLVTAPGADFPPFPKQALPLSSELCE